MERDRRASAPRATVEREQGTPPQGREVIVFVDSPPDQAGPRSTSLPGRNAAVCASVPWATGSSLQPPRRSPSGARVGLQVGERRASGHHALDPLRRGPEVDVALEQSLQAPGGRHRVNREAPDAGREEGLHDLGGEAIPAQPLGELHGERGAPAAPRSLATARAILGGARWPAIKAMIRDQEAAHAAPVHQVPNLADHVPDASVPRGGPEGPMAGGTAGGAHPRGQDRGRSRCPSPRSGRPQLPAITAARGVALQVHEVPRGGTLIPRWSRAGPP